MNNLITVSILSMAGLCVFFAGVLAIADKKLYVQEDPRLDKINRLLPGVNCGACGCLSCHDFAEHIIKEGAPPDRCRVASEESRKEICKLVGRELTAHVPKALLVHCAAETKDKKMEGEYRGIQTCSAAQLVFGKGMWCEYGCMGFGDCVRVCPFGALHMEKGLPRVDAKKCTACGLCVKACPRKIISLEKKIRETLFYVACSSHDMALRTRQICTVGCIACGICERLSPEEFFKVKDNLSYPDYSKQSKQKEVETILAKCPTKAIKAYGI